MPEAYLGLTTTMPDESGNPNIAAVSPVAIAFVWGRHGREMDESLVFHQAFRWVWGAGKLFWSQFREVNTLSRVQKDGSGSCSRRSLGNGKMLGS